MPVENKELQGYLDQGGNPAIQTLYYCNDLLTRINDKKMTVNPSNRAEKRVSIGLEDVPVNSHKRRISLAHLSTVQEDEFWTAAYGNNENVHVHLPVYASRWPKSQRMSDSRVSVEQALNEVESQTYFRAGVRAPKEELQLAEALKKYFYDLGAVALKSGDRNANWLLASGLLREIGSWIVIEGKVSR